MLRRPELKYDDLPNRNISLTAEVTQQVEIFLKYEGYIKRQEVEVERSKTLETKQIPATFDYQHVTGLRYEARQKLLSIKPATLAQASRISGVSPADISLLLVHLKRGNSPVPATISCTDDLTEPGSC